MTDLDVLLGRDEFVDEVFVGVELGHQRLQGKDFDGCRFERCSLQEAELVGCSFRDPSFAECNLSVMRVTNSRFLGAHFSGSKVSGIDWTQAQWGTIGDPVCFEDQCVLDYSVFLGLKLRNARFRYCSAHEVDFTEADLTESDFSGTDLEGARFNHTNLTRASMESAYNYSIDPANNVVTGMRVSLPEASSFLRHLDLSIVDRSER